MLQSPDSRRATVATTDAVPAPAARRSVRAVLFAVTLVAVLGLLFGVPWWTLFEAGTHWPTAVVVFGTVVFAVALVAFPVLMVLGHGKRRDWAAVLADT